MFVNLHVHDAYGSLLDSILTPEDIAKFAAQNKQPAIAITNHGYMSSFVDFHKACLKYGVKPIHGCEIYECDDDEEKADTKDYKQPRYHLVLLAKNKKGLQNLFKIVSYGCTDGFYRKPRISLKRIRENDWGYGIICLTACQAGRLSKLLEAGEYTKAKDFWLDLEYCFDDVYCEIQSHNTEDQARCNRKIKEFADDIGCKYIVTTDAHMLSPSQSDSHSIFVEIGEGREVGETYADCYLQTEEDVYNTLIGGTYQCMTERELQRAIENTYEVAEKIELIDIGITKKALMPKVAVEGNFESHEAYLRHLVYSTFDQKFGHMSEIEQKKRRNRIEEELPILFALEYTDYFIMLYMLIDAFRKANIPLGYARGSAAGSLCLFMLNVTQIDSVRWELDFSRFANLGRKSMADCDIDISKRKRKQAVEIAAQLFSPENVAPICTFNSLSTKVAIRDIGKVLNDKESSPYFGQIPYTLRDEVAKMIPTIKTLNDLGEEEEKEVLLRDVLLKNAKLQEVYENFPLWFKHVMVLEGLPKSRGKHAAGVLITPDPVVNHCPTCLDSDGGVMVQLEMHAAMDDLSMIKMDLLGLKTLDVIDDALNSAGLTWNDVDINHLDLEDESVYQNVYQYGSTIGIFQMESYEARRMCIDSKADNIENIIVVNAANRPGTKDSFPEYCRNKLHPELEDPVHPDLSRIFSASHGILLYQEQALQVFRYAGFPEEDVDNARRSISKKDLTKMNALKVGLYKGLRAKTWTDKQCDAIWDLLLKQASYSFNRCVAGDTYIHRDPNGRWQPTIAEMYRIKHDREYAKRTGHRSLNEKYNSKVGYGFAKSMFEDGRIHPNRIVDIYYSGEREVFEVKTVSGKTIQCTSNHKFPTPLGIKKLCDINVGDELYVMGEYDKKFEAQNLTGGDFVPNYPSKGQCGFQKRDDGASVVFEREKMRHQQQKDKCEICGCAYGSTKFELHHKDGDRTNNTIENYQWLCCSCHKKIYYRAFGRNKKGDKGYPVLTEKIISIESVGLKDTYDVEMADPAHNFVVSSGIVTSNSHAVAYGLLSYLTAYLKVHYPVEFMAACLTNDSDNVSKISVFINEAKRMGVNVLPPHINKSGTAFTPIPDQNKILFGLLAVKGLGESAVNNIISMQPYAGFDDFVSKVTNKTSVVQLIKAGAIPTKNKMKMLQRYAEYCYSPTVYKPVATLPTKAKLLLDWDINQDDYKIGKKVDREAVLNVYNQKRQQQHEKKELSRKKQYMNEFYDKYCKNEFLWEFETLSMFVTDDPLKDANAYITTPWDEVSEGEIGLVVCVIVDIENKKDKNGNLFAYIDLYTPYGIIESTCWSSQMKDYGNIIKKGACLAIRGRKAEGGHLFVEAIKPYEKWLADRKLKLPH